jgi:F-box interacting protein
LTNITQTQFPSKGTNVLFVGSCDGILCLVIDGEDSQGVDYLIIQLWNPSIRKFKELPSTNCPQDYHGFIYGFGYDLISHNYKVVIVFNNCDERSDFLSENEVKVHTLGTDSWKTVSQFPFPIVSGQRSGQHVNGTINWSVSTGIKRFIVSFDLGNECYQEVSLPNDDSGEVDRNTFKLSVFRDCLCIIFGEDFWVMKEYGNKKSWTKLFTISCVREPWASSYPFIRAIRVLEDEQVLLLAYYRRDKRWEWENRWRYVSYNGKNETSNLIEFDVQIPKFCVESLISPCS